MVNPENDSIFSLASSDPAFSPLLAAIPDPPAVLYGRGNPRLLAWEPKVAIIGSRSPTEYGKKVARELASGLARAGVCVVSGLAMGIDGIAHRGALAVGGETIAVLGTAIDELSPKTNLPLAREIVAKGLVVSEYPPGSPGNKAFFSRRNRLISGLARGVVIVEAAEKSGTLITAGYALQQGRELFVVPGRVDSEKSVGTLALLREGARMVRSAADLLADLDLPSDRRRVEFRKLNQYSKITRKGEILDYLGDEPVPLEELMAASSLSPAALAQALLELEVAGVIRRLPGPKFARG